MAEIEGAIQEYGKEKGYNLILNSVAGLKNIIYAENDLDLSDAVIDLLNLKYEVKLKTQKSEDSGQKASDQ